MKGRHKRFLFYFICLILIFSLAQSVNAALGLDMIIQVVVKAMGTFWAFLMNAFSFLLNWLIDLLLPTMRLEMISKPSVNTGNYFEMAKIIMEAIIPIIMFLLIYTSIKLIFSAQSPGERSMAKTQVQNLLIALILIPISPHLYQIVLDISYDLTCQMIGRPIPNSTALVPGVYQDILQTQSFSALIGGVYSSLGDWRYVFIFGCTFTTAFLAYGVIFFRHVLVVFFGALMPLTVLLYQFDFTKSVGRKFLKWSITWAFVPVAMSIWIIVGGIMLSNIGSKGIDPDTGTIMVMAFMSLIVMSPLILTGALEMLGAVVAGAGQLTPGLAGAGLTAAGQMMKSRSPEGLVVAATMVGAKAVTQGGFKAGKSTIGAVAKGLKGGGEVSGAMGTKGKLGAIAASGVGKAGAYVGGAIAAGAAKAGNYIAGSTLGRLTVGAASLGARMGRGIGTRAASFARKHSRLMSGLARVGGWGRSLGSMSAGLAAKAYVGSGRAIASVRDASKKRHKKKAEKKATRDAKKAENRAKKAKAKEEKNAKKSKSRKDWEERAKKAARWGKEHAGAKQAITGSASLVGGSIAQLYSEGNEDGFLSQARGMTARSGKKPKPEDKKKKKKRGILGKLLGNTRLGRMLRANRATGGVFGRYRRRGVLSNKHLSQDLALGKGRLDRFGIRMYSGSVRAGRKISSIGKRLGEGYRAFRNLPKTLMGKFLENTGWGKKIDGAYVDAQAHLNQTAAGRSILETMAEVGEKSMGQIIMGGASMSAKIAAVSMVAGASAVAAPGAIPALLSAGVSLYALKKVVDATGAGRAVGKSMLASNFGQNFFAAINSNGVGQTLGAWQNASGKSAKMGVIAGKGVGLALDAAYFGAVYAPLTMMSQGIKLAMTGGMSGATDVLTLGSKGIRGAGRAVKGYRDAKNAKLDRSTGKYKTKSGNLDEGTAGHLTSGDNHGAALGNSSGQEVNNKVTEHAINRAREAYDSEPGRKKGDFDKLGNETEIRERLKGNPIFDSLNKDAQDAQVGSNKDFEMITKRGLVKAQRKEMVKEGAKHQFDSQNGKGSFDKLGTDVAYSRERAKANYESKNPGKSFDKLSQPERNKLTNQQMTEDQIAKGDKTSFESKHGAGSYAKLGTDETFSRQRAKSNYEINNPGKNFDSLNPTEQHSLTQQQKTKDAAAKSSMYNDYNQKMGKYGIMLGHEQAREANPNHMPSSTEGKVAVSTGLNDADAKIVGDNMSFNDFAYGSGEDVKNKLAGKGMSEDGMKNLAKHQASARASQESYTSGQGFKSYQENRGSIGEKQEDKGGKSPAEKSADENRYLELKQAMAFGGRMDRTKSSGQQLEEMLEDKDER